MLRSLQRCESEEGDGGRPATSLLEAAIDGTSVNVCIILLSELLIAALELS